MRSSFRSFLFIFATFLPNEALSLYAGNAGAAAACRGVPNGSLKCLTDVSYAICNYGREVEQFVAAGTYCSPGSNGGSDMISRGAASTTVIFGSAAAPVAPPPNTSGASASAIATSQSSLPSSLIVSTSFAPQPASSVSSLAPPPPPPPPPSSSAFPTLSNYPYSSPFTTSLTDLPTLSSYPVPTSSDFPTLPWYPFQPNFATFGKSHVTTSIVATVSSVVATKTVTDLTVLSVHPISATTVVTTIISTAKPV